MRRQKGQMTKRLSNTIWLVVAAGFVVAGCTGQSTPNEADALAVRPADAEKLLPATDYAARAIQAAGGLPAWKKKTVIEFDCVVTSYQQDNTFYLTEQHYQVFPWSNSIRISGREPEGEYVWQLSNGRFGVLQGREQYNELWAGVDSSCVAEIILNVVTTPARLLDESAEFARVAKPVKLQGQWYYPIQRSTKAGLLSTAPLRDAVFNQNRDTMLVDMLLLACGDANTLLIVRGHDEGGRSYSDEDRGIQVGPERLGSQASSHPGRPIDRRPVSPGKGPRAFRTLSLASSRGGAHFARQRIAFLNFS